LRLHLSNVAKYAHQPHAINLQDPDTLQHYLDARFAQLNTSVELELWQEAFRSVEDVHNLLIMAKKAPRPAMMANYYEKLTKIFLMSGNALYHAAAWGRFYGVTTTIGGRSDEELSRLAGQVLISALAVPVNQKAEESVEEVKGRTGRLTSLLGLAKTPTRTGLLKDAVRFHFFVDWARY
jgi:translation initiation factor 3 subunit A